MQHCHWQVRGWKRHISPYTIGAASSCEIAMAQTRRFVEVGVTSSCYLLVAEQLVALVAARSKKVNPDSCYILTLVEVLTTILYGPSVA